MRRLFGVKGKKNKNDQNTGDSIVEIPEAVADEVVEKLSMVDYFASLDIESARHVQQFLEPLLPLLVSNGHSEDPDNDGSADYLTARVERHIKEKFRAEDLSAEQKGPIKVKFDRFLHVLQDIVDRVNREEAFYQQLNSVVFETRISIDEQQYLQKFIPSLMFKFKMGNEFLPQAFLSRTLTYFFHIYHDFFGSQATKDIQKSTSTHGNCKAIEEGLLFHMKPVSEKYWHELRSEIHAQLNPSQPSSDVSHENSWDAQNFIKSLIQFKDSQSPASIVGFLNNLDFIIFKNQGVSTVDLTDEEMQSVFKSAVNLNMFFNFPEHEIDELARMVVILRTIEEKLASSDLSVGGSNSLLDDIAGILLKVAITMFSENGVELTPQKREEILASMKQSAAEKVTRANKFVQLIQAKLLQKISEQQTDMPQSPVRIGLQQGFAAMHVLQRGASVLVAEALSSATRPKQDFVENRKLPANNPGLLKRFHAKWKKLKLRWKVVAGVLIGLGVLGIIAGTVFLGPAGAVVSAILGKVAVSTLVASGSGALVGATTIGHLVHISKQRLPDATETIELQGARSKAKRPILSQTIESDHGGGASATPASTISRDIAKGAGRRIDFSSDGNEETMIKISGAALVAGKQGTFPAPIRKVADPDASLTANQSNTL